MKREQLEHVIRAAAAITNEYELVIMGSQSILGAFPDAPADLLRSLEADIYPLNRPELSELIEGSLGRGSQFETFYGYFADGIDEKTCPLPVGWKDRLVKIQNANTDLKIGYCLDPRDLAASKLIAGREKDWEFVHVMLKHKLVNIDEVLQLVDTIDAHPVKKSKAKIWLNNFHARNANLTSEPTGPSGP